MRNIFEEFQARKHAVTDFLNKAERIGWINGDQKVAYLKKIENDVLTIGVIGQMKAGKSTFLNAFVFEDDILPAATTPMTAALSVVTYGPEKKIEAEFYTRDEWEEQKATASMDPKNITDDIAKSKVQAARELMDQSEKLGNRVNNLLGKTQTDRLENLKDYVGADGTYVSITKSVKIYYPKDYLKGVNIVDTPGFNDPIVSREQRTKDFLKNADVVLLMLYAGRPFDATDRTILFKNVGEVGIGKVLIGINKYDIPYGSGDTEEEIKNYVRKEISKASQEMGSEELNEILKDADPIPVSAEMALLSELPMSKVNNNEHYSYEFKRYQNDFDITNQDALFAQSHLQQLSDAVRSLIEKEKNTILFRKPVNAIMAIGNKLEQDLSDKIVKSKDLITNLQLPDDELEDKERNLQRVTRRLDKKITGFGDDLDEVFDEIIRKGSEEMEDAVSQVCKSMKQDVDNWGILQSVSKIQVILNSKVNTLFTRTLRRIDIDIKQKAKREIQKTMDDFFSDAESVLIRLDDFDARDFVKHVSHQFNFDDDSSLFEINDTANESEENAFLEFIEGFLDGFTKPLQWLGRIFDHGEVATEYKNNINNLERDFNAENYLSSVITGKDTIIAKVKESFEDELLTPFQKQLEEVKDKTANKEKCLEEEKTTLIKLNREKTTLDEHVHSMEQAKVKVLV